MARVPRLTLSICMLFLAVSLLVPSAAALNEDVVDHADGDEATPDSAEPVGTAAALEFEDGDADYDQHGNDADAADAAAAEAAEAVARMWEAEAEAEDAAEAAEAEALGGGSDPAAGELSGAPSPESPPKGTAETLQAIDPTRGQEHAERGAEGEAAGDGANAEREAAMDAARKVAEDARLRRIEEMQANRRAADAARGVDSARSGGGSDHRERTEAIKRAVQGRVEAARLQMEAARHASKAGRRASHDDL